jgi:hypothetical protein
MPTRIRLVVVLFMTLGAAGCHHGSYRLAESASYGHGGYARSGILLRGDIHRHPRYDDRLYRHRWQVPEHRGDRHESVRARRGERLGVAPDAERRHRFRDARGGERSPGGREDRRQEARGERQRERDARGGERSPGGRHDRGQEPHGERRRGRDVEGRSGTRPLRARD